MSKARTVPTENAAIPEAGGGMGAGQKVQDAIGRALEAHYIELVREPIPNRLLELLSDLEKGALHHE